MHTSDAGRNTAWQPWQMRELSSRPGPQAQPRRGRDVLCDQEFEAARVEGYDAGFEGGRQAGFDAGHAQGLCAGRADGLMEGRRSGEAEYDARLQQALEPLQRLAVNLDAATDRLDDTVADELVDLALTVGRHLAGEALQARPEAVLSLIRELLRNEPLLAAQPRLWLNPEDLELVTPELRDELTTLGWQMQGDDRLERGGCRVTSTTSELDATQESRWQGVLDKVRMRKPSGARAERAS